MFPSTKSPRPALFLTVLASRFRPFFKPYVSQHLTEFYEKILILIYFMYVFGVVACRAKTIIAFILLRFYRSNSPSPPVINYFLRF